TAAGGSATAGTPSSPAPDPTRPLGRRPLPRGGHFRRVATPRRQRGCGGHYDPRVSVAGKTALVTGAATGIGAATARLLAARGARVIAAGLQPEALHGTVAAIAAAGGEA